MFFSDASEIVIYTTRDSCLVFYGTVGSILGIFIALVYWDVGAGYNEYNRDLKAWYNSMERISW